MAHTPSLDLSGLQLRDIHPIVRSALIDRGSSINSMTGASLSRSVLPQDLM